MALKMNIWSPDESESRPHYSHLIVSDGGMLLSLLEANRHIWVAGGKNGELAYKVLLDFYRQLLTALDLFIDRQRVVPLRNVLLQVTNEMVRLRSCSDMEAILPVRMVRAQISDCFVILQQYQNALEFYPKHQIGRRSSHSTDRLLSLRFATGGKLTGEDVLALCGPMVTAFGRSRLTEIVEYLKVLLEEAWHNDRVDFVADWASDSTTGPYQVFIGTPYGYFLTKLVEVTAFTFSGNPRVVQVVRGMIRQAENVVRSDMGIPHVGEGWVSETELYYLVKRFCPEVNVLHHATPAWLKGQHLDVYIPDMNVALEYQGAQHDEPVEFFNGREAFEQVKRRDLRKKRACSRSGVRLIYVRPGYDPDALVAELRRMFPSSTTA